jgi:hypothetical protein
MNTRKQELTLFCGFDVTPWPKIAIEVEKSICCPVKWKYNSFQGLRRDSGKFESKIIVRGPRKNSSITLKGLDKNQAEKRCCCKNSEVEFGAHPSLLAHFRGNLLVITFL